MSRYSVEIKEEAQYDLKVLSKSEPKAYQKALHSLQNCTTIHKQEQANQNNNYLNQTYDVWIISI